jgi:adenylate cyclase
VTLEPRMGKDKELVILFADVVGSTRLFEVLGDLTARDKVAICVDIMRGATEQRGGSVVKTMGDEILATFEDCDKAMDAAVQMQVAIEAHPELDVDGQHIAIRIGCHFGPVVLETRDVFGAAVHTANRMTSQAKAGQIIITDSIFARLSDEWRAIARQVDVAVPRGQQGEVTIFEVLWQHGDTTSMLPLIATITEQHRSFRIRLTYLGEELILDDRERASATLGRGQENDLVIKGNLVSRLHARIEAGKNRFMLIDESTNGSFVQGQNGDDAFVRRDAIPLKGKGVIGLGRVPEPQSYHTVEFSCEEGTDTVPSPSESA